MSERKLKRPTLPDCIGDNNIACITGFMCNIDFYETDYSDNTEWELFDIIFSENTRLPLPTITTHSGRGIYFIYVFDEVQETNKIKEWNETQDKLSLLLKKYGASQDRNSRRMLRLPNTINSNNGKTVRSFKTNERFDYHEISRVIDLMVAQENQ